MMMTVLAVGAALTAIGSDYVLDAAKWRVDRGAKEGVKAQVSPTGGLRIVLPETATNSIQLTYAFGKDPLKLTPYPCLEATIKSGFAFRGGEFYFIPAGWAKGGDHVGISSAYKAKNPNWWSHQRDALIGCFHNAKDMVFVGMVNPRESIPADKEVTIQRELAKMTNMTTNRTIAICYLRLPGNTTGKEQAIEFPSIKVLDEVLGDAEWVAAAKQADAELAAIGCCRNRILAPVSPCRDFGCAGAQPSPCRNGGDFGCPGAQPSPCRNGRADLRVGRDSAADLEPPADHRFASPFAVVKDGQPAAEIVLAPETAETPVLKTAAEELQKWIKVLTGVEIPICSDGKFTKGVGGVNVLSLSTNRLNRILLGKRLVPSYRNSRWFANDGWNEILAKLSGRDGYAIRINPENPCDLHVFGAKDKGTMNGVYALLENNTDIIWARPDETLGTVYTKTPGELSFVWGDGVVDVPDSMSRGWNTYGGREWMARNKCNLFNGGGGGDIEWTNPGKKKWGVFEKRHLGGHNIFHFLKGETDPLLFAHNDEGVRTGGQPCWSNPRTLAIFTSNVLNCARMQTDGPGKLYINLQDSWKSCLCSKCRSAFRAPDGTWLEPTDENFYSTHYFMFMNKVAEALVKEMPEKGIMTLAYFGSLPKPACAIHPALTPEWAPYPQQDIKRPLYHPSNRLHFQHLLDWHAALPPERIAVYGYWGLYFATWRPVADVIKYDIRLLNKWTQGCTSEVREWREPDACWDLCGVEFWTITRLYWNPYQDPQRLRERYIRRTYREAAPAVEKFYGAIRQAYFADDRPDMLGGGARGMKWLNERCSLAELRGCLAEAKALVKHPQAKVLVDRLFDRFVGDCEKSLNPPKKNAKK